MSRLYRLLWITLLVFVSSPAFAQYTRDAAANKKIDEAINTHYVATDFEKAEGVLLGTINACGDKCAPQTLGKAWMYVGIVRGSGKNNQNGAREAFQKAVAADPNVKLDTVLATPETQATFAAVTGGAAPAAPEPAAAPAPAPAAPAAAPPGGGLTCTPTVTKVQTRRPIPVQCTSDEDVTSMELKYKSFGSDTWKTAPMRKKGTSYRVQLPCTATDIPGALKIYVRAKDAQGEQVDSWGSKQQPIVITLGEKVDEDPPSFDDADAPARCAVKEECPPDFPGCGGSKSSGEVTGKDWGASCENSTECKSGLLCQDGTCQTAPSCDSDGDCTTGLCSNGKCDVPDRGSSSGSASAAAGPYKRNWLGLNVAQDIGFIGGQNVCDRNVGKASENYACFYQGSTTEPFFHRPYPLRDGIQAGAVLATTRVLLSYDRAFSPKVTLGARVGFAFGGGPPAGMSPAGNATDPPAHSQGTGGTAFFPIHLEVRGAFWFLPLTAKTLRAYVMLGGGMAQVDAKVSINEYDCEDANEPDLNGKSAEAQCISGKKTYYNIKNHTPVPVDGWKVMGQGFVEGGVGGMLAITPKLAATLEAKLLLMVPAPGVVIQPALGINYGF